MSVAFLTCDEFTAAQAAQDAALKAYTDSKVAAGGVESATSTVEGIVTLHSGDLAKSNDSSLALTAAAFNILANDPSTSGGNTVQKSITNAVQEVIGSDAGAALAVANAISLDTTAATALVTNLADDIVTALGADTAETVAGTEAAKFVTPASMAGALSSQQPYRIDIKFTGVTTDASTSSFLRDGLANGSALDAISFTTVDDNHAISALRKSVNTGSTVAAIRTISTNNLKTYYAHLGYSKGLIRAAVYGDSNDLVTTATDQYYAGYFKGEVYYTAALTPSDERLKDVHGTAEPLNLTIYDFDKYTDTNKKTKLGRMCGVIAQEVLEHRPEFVRNTGDHLVVDTESVMFALLAQSQEQIKILSARIAALEKDLRGL